MKRLFNLMIIATMAASCVAFVSCNKDNGSGNDEGKGDTPAYRIKNFISYWSEDAANAQNKEQADIWAITYNADGKVADVNRGEASKHWIFTYSGNKVTVKKEDGNALVYEMTLNDKGCATEIKDFSKGEAITYTYSYDASGYLKEAKKNGTAVCQLKVNQGVIENWTRVNTKENVEGPWRYKNHTYDFTIPNAGGAYTSYPEDAGMPRWINEIGLLGKTSAYVCLEAQWADSSKKATYEYKYDAENRVSVEIKYYDGGYDCSYGFEYEKIAK